MNEGAIKLQCRCLRAAAYVQEGLYTEALRLLDAALQSHPDCLSARVQRGQTLALLGRLHAAAAEFTRVLELEPGYSEARLNLSAVLTLLGLYGDAELQHRLAQQPPLVIETTLFKNF